MCFVILQLKENLCPCVVHSVIIFDYRDIITAPTAATTKENILFKFTIFAAITLTTFFKPSHL